MSELYVKNPYSGRNIKIGGKTYTRLLTSGMITPSTIQAGSPSIQAIGSQIVTRQRSSTTSPSTQPTRSTSPSVKNPYSGRNIKIDGPTYNKLLSDRMIIPVTNEYGDLIIQPVKSHIKTRSSTLNSRNQYRGNILEELSSTQISLIADFMAPEDIIRLCQVGRHEICKDENSELWVKLLAKDFPNMERTDMTLMNQWISLMEKRAYWINIIRNFSDRAKKYREFIPDDMEYYRTVHNLADDTNVKSAFLYGANLSGYILNYLDFNRDKTEAGYNKVPNTDLRYANLDNTKLIQTNFSEANLTGATLRGAEGNIYAYQTIFINVNMDQINLNGSTITKSDFSYTKLIGIEFEDVTLNNDKFIGADLTDSKFVYCTLSNLDFTDANLTRADLTRTYFNGYRSTELIGMNFTRANLTDTKLPMSRLSDAIFDGAIGIEDI